MVCTSSTPPPPTSFGMILDRLSPKSDAQHLQAQRWHDLPASFHDNRDAAYDAITLRLDAEQAAARRRFFKDGRVDQRCGKETSQGAGSGGRVATVVRGMLLKSP